MTGTKFFVFSITLLISCSFNHYPASAFPSESETELHFTPSETENQNVDSVESVSNITMGTRAQMTDTKPCDEVEGAFHTLLCTDICGEDTCYVKKTGEKADSGYFCDCPTKRASAKAYCGKPAKLNTSCQNQGSSSADDFCQNVCSDMSKRPDTCIAAQLNKELPVCTCFITNTKN